jgi:hypothetical protein
MFKLINLSVKQFWTSCRIYAVDVVKPCNCQGKCRFSTLEVLQLLQAWLLHGGSVAEDSVVVL